MERYNDIRGIRLYPFNLTSIRSFSSPSPITMSTSCPLGIAFAVGPSAVAFSSTQPFSSCTKPFARSTWPHAGPERGRDLQDQKRLFLPAPERPHWALQNPERRTDSGVHDVRFLCGRDVSFYQSFVIHRPGTIGSFFRKWHRTAS